MANEAVKLNISDVWNRAMVTLECAQTQVIKQAVTKNKWTLADAGTGVNNIAGRRDAESGSVKRRKCTPCPVHPVTTQFLITVTV